MPESERIQELPCNWYTRQKRFLQKRNKNKKKNAKARNEEDVENIAMAHEMMKTDTMQFQLILLMRLTRNNNIQTIRFIPKKTNQIEAHQTNERKKKTRTKRYEMKK